MIKLERAWPSLLLMAFFASGAGYWLTTIVQENLVRKHITMGSVQVWVLAVWWGATGMLWILAARGFWLSQSEDQL